ncbi:MAG: CBS domain containing-hemolysin-like protein [Alphaproteobacteria bacterium]|jgi:CBS domain containing-hemolysin-like protein
MTYDILIWLGIVLCLTQSAIFSGLNLAFFCLSRLQLEVEAKQGNESAIVILSMREDSNFLLSTVLWGNVSINILLTLLSGSVLTGVSSFLFSTFVITFLGEIFPQAYFSRNALQVASKLTPTIKVYQILLFIPAKFTAMILDGWLGKEGITYLREKQLAAIIKAHIDSDDSDMEHVQGRGAVNFLQIQNITVLEEGEVIDPLLSIAQSAH